MWVTAQQERVPALEWKETMNKARALFRAAAMVVDGSVVDSAVADGPVADGAEVAS